MGITEELMKNMFTITLIACFMFSCGSTRRISIESVDLKRYSDNGFLITQGSYSGNKYTPIGIIRIVVNSGYTYVWDKKDKRDTTLVKPLYTAPTETYGNKTYTASSLAEGIDLLYQEAKKQDANAIINLSYTYINSNSSWVVVGMAVKIF